MYEHALVGSGNLARIDKAFFDLNAYVSVGFFVLVLADELVRAGAFAMILVLRGRDSTPRASRARSTPCAGQV